MSDDQKPADDQKPTDDPEAKPEKTYTKAELNAAAAAARKADATELKAGKEAIARLAALDEATKSEAQKTADKLAAAEKRATDAEAAANKAVLDAVRERIGAELGIPASVRGRLQGDDEDAIRADAAAVAADLKLPARPAGGGTNPANESHPDDTARASALREAAGLKPIK